MIEIKFTPFMATSTAQLHTTATVVNSTTGEEYWTESVIVTVVEGMTEAQIMEIVLQKTSGFERRVIDMEHARTFDGLMPVRVLEV